MEVTPTKSKPSSVSGSYANDDLHIGVASHQSAPAPAPSPPSKQSPQTLSTLLRHRKPNHKHALQTIPYCTLIGAVRAPSQKAPRKQDRKMYKI
ncbi:hypothetical protein E2C01_030644 [Portunus trituberculatus]|uniref:Uncharacterized protein n=1 Tax=Portunus trituberculatus TaxID=210409 RepID=A0A5B7EQZ1_PORTR|nr:hypothetical protein [Portunus trituberculatus]